MVTSCASAPIHAVNTKGERMHSFPNTFFNIANIDRYDVILGTPFLWSQQALPDIANHEVRFPKFSIRGLSSSTDARVASNPKTGRASPLELKTARIKPSDSSPKGSRKAPQ